MNKRTLVKLAMKERCLPDYHGNLSRWQRYYYTLKTIYLIIRGKENKDIYDNWGEPVIVAVFDIKEWDTYEYGYGEEWEELVVYCDLSYYEILSQGYL